MRPMHEILAAAKPYLWHPGDSPLADDKTLRICSALGIAKRAGGITKIEAGYGRAAVMNAIEEIDLEAEYLHQVARWYGLLPVETSLTDPAYIEFRDKWLDELIEKEKQNAKP